MLTFFVMFCVILNTVRANGVAPYSSQTTDFSDNCITKLFPEIKNCIDAYNNPNFENLLSCGIEGGRVVHSLYTGAQSCIGLIDSQTQDNFIGCVTLAAKLISPKADAVSSIYQYCKPLASTTSYQAISLCALQIVNGVKAFGIQSSILNQFSTLRGITECVSNNIESPLFLVLNCQSIFISTLQSFNVDSLTSLMSQFLQCKANGESIASCATKIINDTKYFKS